MNFPRAARERAHSNCCGPLSKKVGHPCRRLWHWSFYQRLSGVVPSASFREKCVNFSSLSCVLLSTRLPYSPVCIVWWSLITKRQFAYSFTSIQDDVLLSLFWGSGYWISGMISSTVPVYVAESSPLRLRGKLVSSHVALITLGQFIASGVAGLFSSVPRNGWRLVECATQIRHVASPFYLVLLHDMF